VLESEADLAEETARAMRELASTVTDAPPLRLSARPAIRASRAPRPAGRRTWRLWGVPLAAGVAVIALAISLVVIKDLPDGRVAPPTTPASPSTGDAPEYYVMLHQTGKAWQPAGLLVGDTSTGKEVASVAAPPGGTFFAVAGAANDRTFVVAATGARHDPAGGTGQDTARSIGQNASWYLLTLAPGSSSPARLTKLSIPATVPAADIESVALSQDGRELAVASVPPNRISLRIYSVVTGKVLNSWSTRTSMFPATGLFEQGYLSNSTLSWVDDDRALAFSTNTSTQNKQLRKELDIEAVRVLNVTSRGGDLIADSRVVWSRQDSPFIAYYTRPVCNANPVEGGTVPSLTANGKTVVCAALAGMTVQHQGTPQQRTQVRLVWLAFSTSTPKVARTVYKVTAYSIGRGVENINDARWADGSGSTMIIDWAVGSIGPKAQSVTHFGLIRDGTFTPLPTPPDTNLDSLFGQADIAW
jgi:hypothetical protein